MSTIKVSELTALSSPDVTADYLPIVDVSANETKKILIGAILAGLAQQGYCSVYKSATQSIPDSTWTELTFDTEAFDTNSMHSTSSNTGRINGRYAGVYICIANVKFASDGAGTGVRGIRIKLNGTVVAESSEEQVGTGDIFLNMSTTVNMTTGASDYVTLEVYQTSGGALNVGSGLEYTNFQLGNLFISSYS